MLVKHEGDDFRRYGVSLEGFFRNADQVAQTLIGQWIQTEVFLFPECLGRRLTRPPCRLAAPGTAIGSVLKSRRFARIPVESETPSGFFDLLTSQQPPVSVRVYKGVAGEFLERRLTELCCAREQGFDLLLLALVGVGPDPCLHAPEPLDNGVLAFLHDLRPQAPKTVVGSVPPGEKLQHRLDEGIHGAVECTRQDDFGSFLTEVAEGSVRGVSPRAAGELGSKTIARDRDVGPTVAGSDCAQHVAHRPGFGRPMGCGLRHGWLPPKPPPVPRQPLSDRVSRNQRTFFERVPVKVHSFGGAVTVRDDREPPDGIMLDARDCGVGCIVGRWFKGNSKVGHVLPLFLHSLRTRSGNTPSRGPMGYP